MKRKIKVIPGVLFSIFLQEISKEIFFPLILIYKSFMIDEDDQVDVIYATIRYGVHVLDMMHQYI